MTRGNVAGVRKAIFASTGAVTLYGCNLGASGGLAQDMKNKWGLKTTASDTKTDFEAVVGSNWKPSGHYIELK